MSTELEVGTPRDQLALPPIYDGMDPRKLELVRSMAAPKANAAEVAMFLEICHHYDLAWEAKEAWCVKSDSGQLLIMVARDGLRKIAMRNKLRIRSDVVRENDYFAVTWGDDRSMAIEHTVKGSQVARGPIVGAWAECWDEKTGEQRGYFYAPMVEYRPTSEKKLQYSPWGSQESVMIMAAAERQAIRQATPLSGLLAEGEMDLNDERAESGQQLSGEGETPMARFEDEAVGARIEALMARANELVPGTWRPAKIAMAVNGRSEEELAALVEDLRRFVGERAPNDPLLSDEPQDAEVVPEQSEPEAEVVDAEPVEPGMPWDEEAYNALLHSAADMEVQLEVDDLADETRAVTERNLKDVNAMIAQLEEVKPS